MELVGSVGGFGGLNPDGTGGVTVQDLVRAGLIEQEQLGPNGTILGREAVRLGGFLMGADYVRDVANSFGMASTVTAGDDVRFWAGATFANRATAPFRLTEAGALVATSATISGTISASTIDIGGSDATSFHVDVDGNVWAGASTFAAAPFKVSNAGVITASSGTFTGSITGASGTFAGNISTAGYISATGGVDAGYGTGAINGVPSTANYHGVVGTATGTGSGGKFANTTGTGVAVIILGNTSATALTVTPGAGQGGILSTGTVTATGFYPDTNGTRDIGDGTHYIGTVYTAYTICGGTIFVSGAYNQTAASQGMISQHGSHDLAAGTYKLGLVPATGTAPFMYINVGGKVCLFIDATGVGTAC